MTVNFKDWQKTLQENVTDLDEVLDTPERMQDYSNAALASSIHALKKRDTKTIQKRLTGINRAKDKVIRNVAKELSNEETEIEEALKGDQHKLDVDHDGKIEKSDLKKLRKGKDEIVVNDGQNVKEGCMKKSFREFVEELEEAKKDDYWDFKDLKDEPKSTTRKVAGKAYGGAAQKDDDDEDDNNDKPAVKRGRGRPAGSKSGARTAGNGKQYGGLAIHSLNLPSKK